MTRLGLQLSTIAFCLLTTVTRGFGQEEPKTENCAGQRNRRRPLALPTRSSRNRSKSKWTCPASSKLTRHGP